MTIQSIGIAGMGVVGGAVYAGFSGHVPIQRFDIDRAKSDSLSSTLACDAIFVCLPTPMRANTGECDLSIITDFFQRARGVLETLNVQRIQAELQVHKPIFIIKSTVPVGTTRKLARWATFGRFVHNPEFLTEKNANEEFKNQPFVVLGGADSDAIEEVLSLYSRIFKTLVPPNEAREPQYLFNYRVMPSDASEMVKYLINSFLAMKVTFFNDAKIWAKHHRLPWHLVRNAVTQDPRIGVSHSQVPGPDGMHGFGGSCFPKDLSSMIHQLTLAGLSADLPMTVMLRNRQVREACEWATTPDNAKEWT